jgi:predicted nucleic acid-binding protein
MDRGKETSESKGFVGRSRKYALGVGELSTILLAKEIRADTVLLDDLNARKLARVEGLQVPGSLGLLETFYMQGYLTDLRSAFRQLLSTVISTSSC